jgi:uncharacterized protein YndB with AHSA1/START domain
MTPAMENTAHITQLVDASRERVYQAFLAPEDIMRWYYASEGWTTPYARIDAKVGGEFHIGFQSPDRKTDFDFYGTYDELVPNEKIAYTMGDGRKAEVLFSDEGGKTRIDLTFALETTNTAELQRQGWGAQLVHLGEYLTKA